MPASVRILRFERSCVKIMANRIVLNTISYHGKGAVENIVPELTARGYHKAFVCSDLQRNKAQPHH